MSSISEMMQYAQKGCRKLCSCPHEDKSWSALMAIPGSLAKAVMCKTCKRFVSRWKLGAARHSFKE